MTSESLPRRKFIKWAVSSFVLVQVAQSSKALEALTQTVQLHAQAWPDLPVAQQASTLFIRQLPVGARLLASTEKVGIVAAVFETETDDDHFPRANRWLCIASERSPGSHSIQVTADAMTTSTSFNPVEVSLSILDNGTVEVSEQHLRAHEKHVWKEVDGKWCLAQMSFAGNVAHNFVTHDYDLATEQFVTTTSLMDSDDILAMESVSTEVLIELGTYRNGQALV